MAVISISKIQVRRGLQENLPQLAGAEFGWSTDERRLYIGNGTLAEGAPAIGNTEILTQFSDIFSAVGAYSFVGDESGYTSQTGENVAIPVTRTLQHVIDDQLISVRNFGAKGDGVSDDTIAIQRAIDQIYPSDYYVTVGVRRRLHIPAGIYLISSELTIPPYASIHGDGPFSTIIKQSNVSTPSVIKLRDSKKQIDAALGDNLADLPANVEFSNLTLENATNNHVAIIDSATNIAFNRIVFKGSIAVPVNTGSSKALVHMYSSAGATSRVTFDQCHFTQNTYAWLLTDNVSNILANDCVWDTLFRAVEVSTTGSVYPQNIKITSSVFDNIASLAIDSNNVGSVISAFNHYKQVGYGDGVVINSGAATSSVISWGNPNNVSIGDIFDRPASQIALFALITVTGAAVPTLTQLTTRGTLQEGPGVLVLVPSSANVETDTTLVISDSTTAIIDYSIRKSTSYKSGTIKVTQASGVATFVDEYVETSTVDVNLGFRVIGAGPNMSMTYTVLGTIPPADATISYNIRSFIKI